MAKRVNIVDIDRRKIRERFKNKGLITGCDRFPLNHILQDSQPLKRVALFLRTLDISPVFYSLHTRIVFQHKLMNGCYRFPVSQEKLRDILCVAGSAVLYNTGIFPVVVLVKIMSPVAPCAAEDRALHRIRDRDDPAAQLCKQQAHLHQF